MAAFFSTFLEGLLSFLSPCVLPLVPLYMSYLATDEEEKDSKKVLIFRTVFFVLGIFTVFCILALSVSLVQKYLNDYKEIIGLIGGVIVILFSLHHLGIIKISFLDRELRINYDLKPKKMTLLKAYLFGFVFAFAWTPCIGPMLTSALLLASTSSAGVWCLFGYALGLILPFLITGLATTFVLDLIRKHKDIFKYVTIVSGLVLFIFGGYMLYDNASSIVAIKNHQSAVADRSTKYSYLPDNQYKTTDNDVITLDKYEGDYLFLNFTTTWCDFCKSEVETYNEFCKDKKCLLVMSPMNNGEAEETIYDYVKEYNVKVPILIDETNGLFSYMNVNSYPTLWVIGPDQSLLGYVSGALDSEGFKMVEEKAIEMYESREN